MVRHSSKARAKFTIADKRALNKVKKAVNAREHKFFGTVVDADPNSTGLTQILLGLNEGPGQNERIGEKVTPVSMRSSGIVTLHASATDSSIRMVIVRDNLGSTTRPAIADLYTSATSFINNAPTLGTVQSKARFTILWDKYIIMDGGGHGLTQKWSMSKKLAKKPVLYSGPTSTDEGKNQLYLFIASNEATNDPAVAAEIQVFYTDS